MSTRNLKTFMLILLLLASTAPAFTAESGGKTDNGELRPLEIEPYPLCAEDPCRIVIGGELYCAEPDYFCEEPSDDYLDTFPTPHDWSAADIDMFIASVREGDTDGDITDAALDELRTLIESGGTIDDITLWFIVYFDQGAGLESGDPGDKISTAACKQACRRLPGVLPSQCRKVCKRVKNASRVGFKGLCEHMDRHKESGRKLCWKIYDALWPSDTLEDPESEPEAFSRSNFER